MMSPSSSSSLFSRPFSFPFAAFSLSFSFFLLRIFFLSSSESSSLQLPLFSSESEIPISTRLSFFLDFFSLARSLIAASSVESGSELRRSSSRPFDEDFFLDLEEEEDLEDLYLEEDRFFGEEEEAEEGSESESEALEELELESESSEEDLEERFFLEEDLDLEEEDFLEDLEETDLDLDLRTKRGRKEEQGQFKRSGRVAFRRVVSPSLRPSSSSAPRTPNPTWDGTLTSICSSHHHSHFPNHSHSHCPTHYRSHSHSHHYYSLPSSSSSSSSPPSSFSS